MEGDTFPLQSFVYSNSTAFQPYPRKHLTDEKLLFYTSLLYLLSLDPVWYTPSDDVKPVSLLGE